MRPPEDGLFLVRESIRHPGDYVLCVSVSGEVIHYRVMYQDGKLTIDNTQYFYNLIDMIEVRNTRMDPSWFFGSMRKSHQTSWSEKTEFYKVQLESRGIPSSFFQLLNH